MTDIESDVIKRLSTALRVKYPTIRITDQYTPEPPRFPHLSVEEADSYTDLESLPLNRIPAADRLMYEINAHSNDVTDRKTICKDIMNIVQEEMQDMGFVRTYRNRVSDLENATIYRIVARYTKLQPNGGNV